MNCSQANSLLVAYLNQEVSSTEKEAMQAHLADCSNCRAELRSLSGLENRLRQHMHMRATQVNPSTNALNTLQARIERDKPPKDLNKMKTISNRFPVQKRITTPKLALALIVILALLFAAPPALTMAARISDWVGTWFHFRTPGTESSMSIGDFKAFAPYSPQYLPEGFDSSGAGGTTAPDLERLELTYSRGEQFVTLMQSIGAGVGDLPQGKNVDINDSEGVFVQVFATSSKNLQQKIPVIPIMKEFDYGITSLLAWNMGEVRIELFSNLPEAEIVKIAQSLAPAEREERQDVPVHEP